MLISESHYTPLEPKRGFFKKFTEHLTKRRKYNAAVNELTSLSDRELSDMNISRSEIKYIALRTSGLLK